MLTKAIVRLVEASYHRAWLIILVACVLSGLAAAYVAGHFAINTNTEDLISPSVSWRQRQIAFDKLFPQLYQRIIIVVDGDTTEKVQDASGRLAAALEGRKDVVS